MEEELGAFHVQARSPLPQLCLPQDSLQLTVARKDGPPSPAPLESEHW